MSNVIIYKRDDGRVAVVVPTPEFLQTNTIEDVRTISVPTGKTSHIVDISTIPDQEFRDAWDIQNNVVVEDLVKVKEMAHTRRRARRSELLKPYDDIIALQIPNEDAAAAEAARVNIRDNDSAVQAAINTASDVAGVKAVLITYGA